MPALDDRRVRLSRIRQQSDGFESLAMQLQWRCSKSYARMFEVVCKALAWVRSARRELRRWADLCLLAAEIVVVAGVPRLLRLAELPDLR